MKNVVNCTNLDKILNLTGIMSNFGDNETKNLKIMLTRISSVFKCENIAFIQKDFELNTDNIITPSECFHNYLLNNNLDKLLLSYSECKNEVSIIDSENKIFSDYLKKHFFVISPIILQNKHIGCLISTYALNSPGAILFQLSDLSHYQLIANIISIQENSYRIKKVLNQTIQYRHILNDLSEELLTTEDSNIDNYIQHCIEKTCKVWNIDRGYLFILDFEEQKLRKTNEWCKKNVKSLLYEEREIHMDSFPWNQIINYFLESSEPIHIPNMINLKYDGVLDILKKYSNLPVMEIKKQLDYLIHDKNLKSILMISISNANADKLNKVAILGFSQVLDFKVFSDQLIAMLKTLSYYLSNAIKRRSEYENKTDMDKYLSQNIAKWRKDNQKNFMVFNELKSKLKNIFESSNIQLSS